MVMSSAIFIFLSFQVSVVTKIDNNIDQVHNIYFIQSYSHFLWDAIQI